jgi:hypothetical protein
MFQVLRVLIVNPFSTRLQVFFYKRDIHSLDAKLLRLCGLGLGGVATGWGAGGGGA